MAEIIQKLRGDVGTEAMVLYYQPKTELPSEAAVGVEALVRWNHPTRGLVYPDNFLPLVEQAGFMQSLTKSVLGTTGHSSLACLQDLPVHELKIDRSFVMRLGENANSASIVKSTIDLGYSLGLKVVAEGVESLATLRTLAVWNCDLDQGCHLSRPQPAEQLMPWLRQRRNNPPAEIAIAASRRPAANVPQRENVASD